MFQQCAALNRLGCTRVVLQFLWLTSGGWREWSDGVQNQAVPITPPPTYTAPCCDHSGPSNAAVAAACSIDMNTPTRSECAPVTSQSPGTSSPAMLPMTASCCPTCQSRGSFDTFYPARPPAAVFNPFFPAFAMHPQLLNLSGSRANDCLVHRPENGVAAAATMQYGNESEFFHPLHLLSYTTTISAVHTERNGVHILMRFNLW